MSERILGGWSFIPCFYCSFFWVPKSFMKAAVKQTATALAKNEALVFGPIPRIALGLHVAINQFGNFATKWARQKRGLGLRFI